MSRVMAAREAQGAGARDSEMTLLERWRAREKKERIRERKGSTSKTNDGF